MITCMKYLQDCRLSALKDLHPGDVQLAQDLDTISAEVTANEAAEEKLFREAAETRVLSKMRLENFGPIGQSRKKVFLAKMLSAVDKGRVDCLHEAFSSISKLFP